MFICRSCARNLVKALINHNPAPLYPITTRPISSTLPTTSPFQRRKVATTATTQKSSSSVSTDVGDNKIALETRAKKSQLSRELQYLTDNVKLAKHVVKLLKQNEAEKALSLVQLAVRDRECTVSWNHLIDHEMSKGRPSSALKIFNDVRSSVAL